MTNSEILLVVAQVREVWPNPEMPMATQQRYADYLRDLPFRAATQAVDDLATRSRFRPSIAEIRESAAERFCDLPPTGTAWGLVKAAVGRLGRYREPSGLPPEVLEAVRVLGWQEICNSDNEVATRAHFERAYAAVRQAAVAQVQTRPVLEAAPTARRLPSRKQG